MAIVIDEADVLGPFVTSQGEGEPRGQLGA